MIEKDINGIKLHYLYTDKFLTSEFGIIINSELSEGTFLEGTLLNEILSKSTPTYPTEELLNDHLKDLYGASFFFRGGVLGNNSFLRIYSRFINDEFKFDDTKIFESIVKVIDDVFSKPVFYLNDTFDINKISKGKKILIDYLESISNNDLFIAINEVMRNVYKGSIYELKFGDKVQDIENITNEQILNYYYKLVNSPKTFYYIGKQTLEEVENVIRNNFTHFEYQNFDIDYYKKFVKDFNEVEIITKEKDIMQSILLVTYKRHGEVMIDHHFANQVFINMLGGTTSSDLFQEIREKNQLAYNVSAAKMDSEGTMVVFAGLDAENSEFAVNIIKDIIRKYQNQEFTEQHTELLATIKKELIASIIRSDDNFDGIYNKLQKDLILGRTTDINDLIKGINDVTLEDVSKAANEYTLASIYLLKGASSNEDM